MLFTLQEITLSECQATHRQDVNDERLEVISFYPGLSCDEAKCEFPKTRCTNNDRTYEVGDKTILGCQECICSSTGDFVCR